MPARFIYLFVFHCLITLSRGLEKEITVNVEPLKQDCFYQSLKATDSVEIEYQVIAGGHGDLDISFSLVDPTGRILAADYKKPDNGHKIVAQHDGDFRFCFDNTYSTFSTKTVFFELIVETASDLDYSNDYDFAPENNDDAVNLEDIHNAINSVKDHLNKARLLQDIIKSTEAKDRNVAEETYFRVNTSAMFVLGIMINVSFIQVVMLKSLFDDRYKFWRYFKR